MPPDHPTPLATALIAACEFAKRHGVDPVIAPAAFGIQRSPAGMTAAVYVDPRHAVTATIDRHGEARFGIARLGWVHLEADAGRPPCMPCGECVECRTVPCECWAERDTDGNIRMDSGRGQVVARREHSRAVVQRWRADVPARTQLAALYDAALALFDREAAQ